MDPWKAQEMEDGVQLLTKLMPFGFASSVFRFKLCSSRVNFVTLQFCSRANMCFFFSEKTMKHPVEMIQFDPSS